MRQNPRDVADIDFLAGGGAMGALIRAHRWERTPLGPPLTWSPSLRTALRILLDSGYPMYLAWGESFIQIYNDAYRPILGSVKHPGALGDSTYNTFAEIWDYIGPMFRRVMELGEASTLHDELLGMDKHGFIEEGYYTFSYSAVREGDRVGGVFVTVLETTERVLRERRQETLAALGAALTGCEAGALARTSVDVLSRNRHDTPFLLAFEQSDGELRLAGHEGLAGDSPLSEPRAWTFRPAGAPLQPVALPDGASLTLKPWPEPVSKAAIIPIVPPGAAQPKLFLVAGLSPRLAFASDYARYLEEAGERIARAFAEAEALEAERKRAEALAEIDRAKTVFFSNVSHEFRTPLTLLLNPVEEIIERCSERLSSDEAELLAVARRNGLRLQRLVNTLLDFSRIEAGRAEASFEPTDLAALTQDLASNFRSAMERAGLAFEVDCPPLDEPVYVDRDMWEKIVLNLLSNAFKFTHSGGVTVTLRRCDRHVELAVRDTGVGIPAEVTPRVFERFFRVPGARGRTFEGTGIGLALVSELAKLHGGSARVESEEGRGTVFTIVIPLGCGHLDKSRVGASRNLSSTATGAQAFVEEAMRWLPEQEYAAQPPSDRPRILLADDNADMRAYVRRLLENQYTVDVVGDGESAWKLFVQAHPDLVIADVMMPHLDGFGLLGRIREIGGTTPVILLSARAGEEARTEGLNAGADDYLSKPFSARELLARVSSRLELTQRRLEPALAAEQHVRELLAESSMLRQLFDHATGFVALLRAPDLVYAFVNKTFDEVTGGRPVLGKRVRDAFPEFADEDFRALETALATGVAQTVRGHRLVLNRGENGLSEEAYFDYTCQPVREADGSISGILLEGNEVTHRVLAERRQTWMIEELNHRVKNTLATVQAIASQTFRHARDAQAARTDFEARLRSLSRAHGLLTGTKWESATLRALLDQELAPHGRERISLAGPDIALSPKAALSLAMTAHELTTNAAKYGALSSPGGLVAVEWRIERLNGGGRLVLSWREQGGPPVKEPERHGFGTRLVEQSIRGELQGELISDFATDGVRHEIRLPVAALQKQADQP